ncbi:MAG: hypothetical protein ACETWO_01365, partial [Candidatus Hadarchaeaceae archaeon]
MERFRYLACLQSLKNLKVSRTEEFLVEVEVLVTGNLSEKHFSALALALSVVFTFVALLGSVEAVSDFRWDIQTLDNGENVGWDTSIAFDSGDNPHISYLDRGDADLKYARWTGTSWEIQTEDNEGDVGWYTSIALDSGDNPHISYFDWGD